MKYATLFTRFMASLINRLLMWLIFLFAVNEVFKANTFSAILDNIVNVFLFLLVFSIVMFFVQIFLQCRFGGNVGQLIMGISVLNKDDKYLSFKEAIFREVVGSALCNGLLGIGYFSMLKNAHKQNWNDMIVDSVVVVKKPDFKWLGIIASIVLGVLIAVKVNNITQNFQKNRGFYLQLIDEIKQESEKTLDDTKFEEKSYPKDTV